MFENLHYNPFFVMVLGMGTVFVGLILLIYLTRIMSYFIEKKNPSISAQATAAAAPVAAPVPQAAAITNRPQFVAAVSAAIATAMGTEPNGLRIHSIQPVGGHANSEEKGRFVAAVSASLAEYMGEDINGIRIHSITRKS